MESILFLLSGNLSSTPRAYKVYSRLAQHYHVRIVGISRSTTWDSKDREMLSTEKNIDYVVLHGLRKRAIVRWLLTHVVHIMAVLGGRIFPKNLCLKSLISSKSNILLLLYVSFAAGRKHYKSVYSFSATLYPSYSIAKRNRARLFVDMEDYYPGEFIHKDSGNERKRRESQLKKILPRATALTSASPLIKEYTDRLIGGHSNHLIILNSFPRSEFIDPASPEEAKAERPATGGSPQEALKLVWFSQNISFNRGLENLLKAIEMLLEEDARLPESVQISLIGRTDASFKSEFIDPFLVNASKRENSSQSGSLLEIIDPMSQTELHHALSDYDVGLALEPGKDLNNRLALSNKILAYAQSGLYILATETAAQKAFMEEDNARGMLSGQSPAGIAEAIKTIKKNRTSIRKNREYRFKSANSLAWENESRKLIKLLSPC